ncbi:phage tail sheath subtilisin-like domain-containing protein [Mycetohabitans sp. B2]|uniref:phage tail sheath family protein n=1 Tax=Mycetohabitans sp. B2 TaxID=2841274 RepID=UPI001F3209F0|nr:phage tail sheath C-terminal domain-containing protein [Mycetohabitans sp. B2]MCF7696881.1 phage tail sheath subtilisin-like domain-containing protein [Mycetohabitans sp. B2]
MPTNVSYPGVYIEEDQSLAMSVPAGKTAVPVFVGVFRTPQGTWADPKQCVRVNTWLEFKQNFGDSAVPAVTVTPPGKVAVKKSSKSTSLDGGAEQENEGSDYAVTIDYKEYLGSLSVRHHFDNGGGVCYILPLDKIGKDEKAFVVPAIEACSEISLLCYCEVTDNKQDQSIYSELNKLLNKKKGYFLLVDSYDSEPPSGLVSEQVAVYYPSLKTTYQRPHVDDALITITGYPGVNNLVDLKDKQDTVSQNLCKKIGEALKAKLEESPVYLRASSAIAGVYCKTDRNRGVWKAPANVALTNVAGLVQVATAGNKPIFTPVTVTEADQGKLNEKGINAIRAFSDQGFVVWGARTLAAQDPEWRYVPVRRLFNSVERDIQQAMRTVMFEPNSPPTWEKVRAAIDNYLYSLWRLGALVGAKPDEAYFVQIGQNITMTKSDIDAGTLIVKVGMAAARPAEFIILQFSQILGGGAS